jgi:hypothetical protein
MTIPTEPIGSIPRPVKLIEAIAEAGHNNSWDATIIGNWLRLVSARPRRWKCNEVRQARPTVKKIMLML